MAFFSSCNQRFAPTSAASAQRRTTVVVAASAKPQAALGGASLAAAGAAAAALLLVGSPAALAAPPAAPVATIAERATAAGPNDKGFFTSLLKSIPSPFPRVSEDPFGAERAQEKTVADTLRPIAIPTEQEAVAPEAFPNPSEAYSERPPVLAAAEGDENLGENAGQFKDLDASGRQELIDRKSPAQAATSNN